MKDNSRHSVLKSFLAAIMVLIMAFSMTTFVFADEEEELGDDETGNTSATESEDGEEEESPYVPAETVTPENGGSTTSEVSVVGFYREGRYVDYYAEHESDDVKLPEILISGDQITSATAPYEIAASYEGQDNVLVMSDEGTLVYTVNVAQTGLYALELHYFPLLGDGNGKDYELAILVDGELPHNDADLSLIHILNQAPHNLDIWQWLFGMPERIRAFCTKGKYHHIEVEDEALIYGEYANGATAVFQTSTGEYPGTNRLEITGDRGKMVLENGVLKLWRLKEAERTFCFEAQEPFAKIPMEYEEMSFSSKGSAHGRIIQNFVNHILFEEPLISDGREGVRELTLSNCAYLSSWEDRWVTLPPENALFDRHLQALCKNSRLNQGNEAPQNAPYQERWRVRW